MKLLYSKLAECVIYLRWPAVLGILAALSYITLNRELLITAQSRQASQGVFNFTPDSGNDYRGASFSHAVQRAAPAVVNIYTRKRVAARRHPLFDDPLFKHYFNNADVPRQQRMESSMGSGVIVSAEGYLLTNLHVVNGVDEVVVSLYDGRDAKASLVGVNKEHDLAVLKIDLDNLLPIAIGSPETARVGDVVLAIGNPFGMGQTVTQGIISATRRRGFNISLFENFIQTDAAINPGNSGGALIDSEGRLLGINTANLNQSGGIGFAIPADIAMQTLTDITTFGRVIRGWLGIEALSLSPQIAAANNLNSTNGVLVTAIYENSPADSAGLAVGDIIIEINDQPVGNGRWGIQEVAESRPGEDVNITLSRDGRLIQIKATLGARPQP